MKTAIFAILCMLVVGCSSAKNGATWLDLPERQLANYRPAFDKPVGDRISEMPEVARNYLKKIIPESDLKSYMPTKSERDLFDSYFALLPKRYQEIAGAKIVRVYFVDNFDSGGMSDIVFDEDRSMYVVLYLNRAVLSLSLQDWIQFRDRSSFRPDGNVKVVSTCSGDYRGLLHTLFHEVSHIYDYYFHVTPYVEQFQRESSKITSTRFVRGFWIDLGLPQKESDVLGDSRFSGYGLRGKIGGSKALELYPRLSGSAFASLYGATSWAEDFAESFTWFYLKTRLGVDYAVAVTENGKKATQFRPYESASSRSRIGVLEEIARD